MFPLFVVVILLAIILYIVTLTADPDDYEQPTESRYFIVGKYSTNDMRLVEELERQRRRNKGVEEGSSSRSNTNDMRHGEELLERRRRRNKGVEEGSSSRSNTNDMRHGEELERQRRRNKRIEEGTSSSSKTTSTQRQHENVQKQVALSEYHQSGPLSCGLCKEVIQASEFYWIHEPCKHKFHTVCNDKWHGENNKNCPVCQKPIEDLSLSQITEKDENQILTKKTEKDENQRRRKKRGLYKFFSNK